MLKIQQGVCLAIRRVLAISEWSISGNPVRFGLGRGGRLEKNRVFSSFARATGEAIRCARRPDNHFANFISPAGQFLATNLFLGGGSRTIGVTVRPRFDSPRPGLRRQSFGARERGLPLNDPYSFRAERSRLFAEEVHQTRWTEKQSSVVTTGEGVPGRRKN